MVVVVVVVVFCSMGGYIEISTVPIGKVIGVCFIFIISFIIFLFGHS